MTNKHRQAFIAWATSSDPKIVMSRHAWPDDDSIELAWSCWKAACEWMAQPPQPTDGALVLDGEFFKRK